MAKYFIKDNYKENLNNLYYNDAPADGVVWQPDVYRYAVAYAKRQGIKNIIDIGSGNGDKLLEYKDQFDITFIDFGANLDIIKSKFQSSSGKHSYIDQDFEESFPKLPTKIIKEAVVVCSDVIEHIRDMTSLGIALVTYSKQSRMLIISTPERRRLYGFDQNGIPTNPCHVREWRMHELSAYLKNEGMDFQIGLTRTNDSTNQRATLCVVSGRDFARVNDSDVSERITPLLLRKFISRDEIEILLKVKGVRVPDFGDNFVGLLNPYPNNYILNHFLRSVVAGETYSANKFKFINQDAFHGSAASDIECLDRTLLQYIGSTVGRYPIAFTLLYGGSTSTAEDDPLLTLSVEHLYTSYLLETLVGCSLWDVGPETLARVANGANLSYINGQSGIKRSVELLAKSIKRKVANGDKAH